MIAGVKPSSVKCYSRALISTANEDSSQQQRQSPGANLRDVFIVWRLKRFPINERLWCAHTTSWGGLRKRNQGNGPPVPERNSPGPLPRGGGLDTHFQSLFVVTDPSAPEVPSILIWSRRSSRSFTIPVRIYSRGERGMLGEVESRFVITSTVDFDIHFIPILRDRNIFLRQNVNWLY